MSYKEMLKTPLKTNHFFEVLQIAKLECVLVIPGIMYSLLVTTLFYIVSQST